MKSNHGRLFVAALLVAGGCASVGPGQTGVLWRKNGGTEPRIYGEGQHVIGSGNKMYLYDLRSLTRDVTMSAMACNGLDLKLTSTVRYHVLPQDVVALQEEIGPDYYDKIIRPLLGAEMRRVSSRYTPEEIYATKRGAIETEVQNNMATKLLGQHIVMDAVLLRNIELPMTVRAAIDHKAVSEQQMQEATYTLALAKAAAEKKQIEALSLAEYNKTIKPSLSGDVLEHERIAELSKLTVSPNGKVIVLEQGAAPAQVAIPAR